MIKLNISLAKFNGTGACASISDENDDDLLIYAAPWEPDPAAACAAAAARLRDAADRFDKLATMKKPFHEATHNKINA